MRGMMLMLNLLRKMPQKFQFHPGMKSPSSTSILQALHAPPPPLGRAGRSHDDLEKERYVPTATGSDYFWKKLILGQESEG